MRNTALVAWYTFLEGLRARFFVGALALSLAFVVLASIVAAVPYGRPDHLIGRIGWGAIFLTGCALSVFYVITTLAREREQRVVNLLLSKPIGRGGYAIGKFAGFYALMTVMIFIEGAVLTASVAFFAEHEPPGVSYWLLGSYYMMLKCGALLAFSAFFATIFVTPMVAMLSTATIFFTGIGSEDIGKWAKFGELDWLAKVGSVLEWLAPQFAVYDIEGWIVYGVQASPELHASMSIYFLGYTLIGLAAKVLAMHAIELK